ncbi:glycosyltransferase family 2 protein [Paenibacillus sp. strain BS8-2]
MKPIISIVVPIYNMEPYLLRCLDSLLGQTRRELEVIAVNDGSTDGSLSVLWQAAAGDERLRVIDSRNQGVSAARNLGLLHCTGDYIGFVDPDDWIDSRMYEEMLDAALREQSDIVMCGYVSEFGGFARVKSFELADTTVYRGAEVREHVTGRLLGPLGPETARPENLDAWGTVWSKLYKAELLHDIKFMDLSLIGSNEDSLFNLSACLRASTFVFLNRPYYHYWRANESSITTRFRPRLESKFLVLYASMEEAYRKGTNDSREAIVDADVRLSNRIAMNVLGLGLNIVGRSNPANPVSKLREIRRLLHHNIYGKALERFSPLHCQVIWRIFYQMAGRKLALPVYIMLAAMEFARTMKPIRRSRHGIITNTAGRHDHESRRSGDNAHELLPSNAGEGHSV